VSENAKGAPCPWCGAHPDVMPSESVAGASRQYSEDASGPHLTGGISLSFLEVLQARCASWGVRVIGPMSAMKPKARG